MIEKKNLLYLFCGHLTAACMPGNTATFFTNAICNDLCIDRFLVSLGDFVFSRRKDLKISIFFFREARDPERTFGAGWRERSWLTLVNSIMFGNLKSTGCSQLVNIG